MTPKFSEWYSGITPTRRADCFYQIQQDPTDLGGLAQHFN